MKRPYSVLLLGVPRPASFVTPPTIARPGLVRLLHGWWVSERSARGNGASAHGRPALHLTRPLRGVCRSPPAPLLSSSQQGDRPFAPAVLLGLAADRLSNREPMLIDSIRAVVGDVLAGVRRAGGSRSRQLHPPSSSVTMRPSSARVPSQLSLRGVCTRTETPAPRGAAC